MADIRSENKSHILKAEQLQRRQSNDKNVEQTKVINRSEQRSIILQRKWLGKR